MKTWVRKLSGVVGVLVAVAALVPFLVGGLCAYAQVADPRTEFNPGPTGLWITLPIIGASALVIWLGLRVCRWGFHRTDKRTP